MAPKHFLFSRYNWSNLPAKQWWYYVQDFWTPAEKDAILANKLQKFSMNIFTHICPIPIRLRKPRRNWRENAKSQYLRWTIGLEISESGIRKILLKRKRKQICLQLKQLQIPHLIMTIIHIEHISYTHKHKRIRFGHRITYWMAKF